MPKHLALRSMTPQEGKVLKAKLRDLSLSARVHQRYRIVDQVHRGYGLNEAADRVGCHFTVAYDWIHHFNEGGFARFEQVPNPKGRPPILRAEQLRELVEVAQSNPQERGLPFSNWSVAKLGEYCRAQRLLPPVTDEWIRRLLRRQGLTPHRIRTWKTSSDPNFDSKKKLIRALYEQCPSRAVVLCFDEWGPLEVRPVGGVAWAKSKRPVRMRATYHRPHGVEHFLAFYDVHGDYLAGVFQSRRGVQEVGDAFRRLRGCYPRRRLFVVLDNLHNVHDHPRFLALLKKLHIHPVWTPTEASWLNLIEPQFGVLKKFTLANTDDVSHQQRQERVRAYLKYRHRRLGNTHHPLRKLLPRRVKLEQH